MDSPSNAIQSEVAPSEEYVAEESKQIAKGGIIVVIGTLAAQALGMVSTLWIARRLGPAEFGLLSLATSLVFPLATLATMGLSGSLVRFIPVHIGQKEDAKVAGTISSAFIMAGLAGLLIALVTLVLSPHIANTLFSDPRLEPVLETLALTIPFIVLTTIALASTRGSKVMHFDAIVQVAGPIFLILAWGVGLLLLTNLLLAAIYATLFRWLISAMLSCGFVYYLYRKHFGSGIDWAFKPLWIYSAPLIVSSLMYTLAPRMDRIVLGIIGDTYAVGVYSLAASVVVILKLAHASIVKTFLPIVADAHNRISAKRAKTLYIAVTRWDTRLTFVGVIVSLLLGREILGLLGEDYAEALLPFVILAVSVYVGTIPGPTGAFLQMTNRQRIEAINAAVFFVLGPIIQLGLGLWLGWIGIAIGVLVTALIVNVVQVSEINYLYNFHPFQKDHLLFTLLSLAVVTLSAIFGITQSINGRLLLLFLVACGFVAFVYKYRMSSDEFLLKMIFRDTPLGRIKANLFD